MTNARMQVSADFERLQSPELVASTNAWMLKFFGAEVGYIEGEVCGRNCCIGIIDTHPSDNCSCHLCAPCSSCTAPRNFCPECDWQEEDDPKPYEPPVRSASAAQTWWKPRTLADLDPTRIDWIPQSHSNASMIKEGVYPAGTTRESLMNAINGTFGGRFEYHYAPEDGRPGRFKYIAYTD